MLNQSLPWLVQAPTVSIRQASHTPAGTSGNFGWESVCLRFIVSG